jgi:hypothetical protein
MVVKGGAYYIWLLSFYVIDVQCMDASGYPQKCDNKTIVTSFRNVSSDYIVQISSLLDSLYSTKGTVEGIRIVDIRFLEAAIFKQAQLLLSAEHKQVYHQQAQSSWDDYGDDHNY